MGGWFRTQGFRLADVWDKERGTRWGGIRGGWGGLQPALGACSWGAERWGGEVFGPCTTGRFHFLEIPRGGGWEGGGQAGLGQGGGWVGQQAIGWMERDETSYA